tara:strand:+ start:5190 stop:5630 length:441 start_codon:yes stop_codon:yes gene_type:complete
MFSFKVESKGLEAALEKYPRRQRKLIGDAIRNSTLEGVSKARSIAPQDTGKTMRDIHARFEKTPFSFVGSVEATDSSRESQIRALSIEFGRRNTGASRQAKGTGKLFRGTTEPQSFIRTTYLLLGKKHRGRINRAINKAAREAGLK